MPGGAKIIAALVAAASCLILAASARAEDEATLFRQSHPWGRFGKGSWRQVRIITESYDEQGRLTNSSVTDNRTTLEEITPERVTLRVEVTVQVAGQKFPSEPQLIRQGYLGETVGQTVAFKPTGSETIKIDQRQIDCQAGQLEILGGVSKEVGLLHYARQQTPPILRRASTTTDVDTGKVLNEMTSEVKALDMSLRVLDESDMKSAFLVRTEQKNDHGSTVTWSWHVPEVPGEVVSQSSRKVDTEGRLVRRSTMELVGYGLVGEGEEPLRDYNPRRARRHKRR